MRVRKVVATAAMIVAASTAPAPPSVAQSQGGRAYVTAWGSDTVSVIDLATDSVLATIPVGDHPRGVAVTPDASRAYVSNERSNSVSVIDTATNMVVATVAVGPCRPASGSTRAGRRCGSPIPSGGACP